MLVAMPKKMPGLLLRRPSNRKKKNSAICILHKRNRSKEDLEEVSSARVQLESRLESAISDLKAANHRWAQGASGKLHRRGNTCKPSFSSVSQFTANPSPTSPFLRS